LEILNIIAFVVRKGRTQVHQVLAACVLQHLSKSIMLLDWVKSLKSKWSLHAMVASKQILISLFVVVIGLILVNFRMSSV